MAKMIVVGLPGEADLWLIDLNSKTVTQIKAPDRDALGEANKLRQSGVTIVKGVNLAVAVSSASSVSSGFMDG